MTNVTIGEGKFAVEVPYAEARFLRMRDLLDHGLAYLLNSMADFLEQPAPQSERGVYLHCLDKLTKKNPVELYTHLLEVAGPEGINEPLWRKLSAVLEWPHCTDVFKDMPTTVLQECAQDIWDMYMRFNIEDEDDEEDYWYDGVWYPSYRAKVDIIQKLGQRTDVYGSANMPPELAFGILIKEDSQ